MHSVPYKVHDTKNFYWRNRHYPPLCWRSTPLCRPATQSIPSSACISTRQRGSRSVIRFAV